MNKYDIVKKIEAFAPLETQEKWDASGWIVETGNQEVEKVLFALTISLDIVLQAKNKGCDMIISHHPLFFVPLEYKYINMYCAHTNFDKAAGGTTDLLLKTLGLKGVPFSEFVRIVNLEREICVENLKQKLLKISPNLRYVNNNKVKTIKTIGFCAGSGSEFIDETPCDAFVTGDLKFHTAIETNKVVFDIGHFESEIFVSEALKNLAEIDDTDAFIADEKSPFI